MTCPKHPSLTSFFDTWAGNCGAPASVFRGHTIKMIEDLLAARASTALDVLLASAPNLEEDILLALRFAYYVRAKPLIPDALYDEAEKEYLDRPEIEDSALMQPGSDKIADYPDRIRALSIYLALLREEKRPQESPAAAQNASSCPSEPPERVETAETPLGGPIQEVKPGCSHEKTKVGLRIPLKSGSAPTQVCLSCGEWRTTHHSPDPWRPAASMAEALRDDELF